MDVLIIRSSCRSWRDNAIVANDSGKHNGESRISYRGRKRLRYVLYEAAISLVGRMLSLRKYMSIIEPVKKPVKEDAVSSSSGM